MHVVDELFVGDKFRTNVWIAKKPQKELKKFVERGEGRRFLQKLQYYARAGFDEFEGDRNPIRNEGWGTWRIAEPFSLFRLIGFYEGVGKESFIVIDAFAKSGTGLSAAERGRIRQVARVKRDGLWTR